MISATVFYLVIGIILTICYALWLIYYKNFPKAIVSSTTCCSLVCTLIVAGIIYLINNANETAGWIVAILLTLCHLGGIIFGSSVITTKVNGETTVYTS